ncbi:MAG: hypothetical protein ABEL76_07485 [Bradymonadaceae bacterium]
MVVIVGLVAAAIGCNSHPVEFTETTAAIERRTVLPVRGGRKVDILWVVDNSQSMCQEQRELRDNFDRFVRTLRGTPVDFHIATTTTHFEQTRFENVARPGHLQSTPHPLTGFDELCRFAPDDTGKPKDYDHPGGPDFSPLIEQINQAVACTKNPEDYADLKNPSRATIECALFSATRPDACRKAGENPATFELKDLFPPQHAYRSIPKVLRAERYETSGKKRLDFDQLQRDFSCMSFVGTRGHSYEQGLHAAVRAVSPELTGGPVGSPIDDGAPNHGLIRKNADFAVIFVTDENDCSHEGDAIRKKDRKNDCGEANCYFPTKGDDQSPLIPTDELHRRFMENLAASKRVDSVDPENVVVASIHGKYRRYSGTVPDTCSSDESYVQPVCRGPRGQARSGDRYEDFMREFERIVPERSEAGAGGHLPGLMCRSNLRPAIEAIAEEIEPRPRKCIRRRIQPCKVNSDCPSFEYGSAQRPVCRKWGLEEGRFCTSATQVRIRARDGRSFDDVEKALRETGLCIPESIGDDGFARSCVADRSLYEWKACRRGTTGVTVAWKRPARVRDVLGSWFEVVVRFVEQVRVGGRNDEEGAADGSSADSPTG